MHEEMIFLKCLSMKYGIFLNIMHESKCLFLKLIMLESIVEFSKVYVCMFSKGKKNR